MAPTDPSPTTVVRPRARRRLGYAVLVGVTFGLLPAAGALALVVSGGAVHVLAAVVIVVLQVVALLSAGSNIGQQWLVGADSLEMRRPGRSPRTWARTGLQVSAVASPVYYRGIRVGTSRSVMLSHDGADDKVDASILGKEGVTALVAAVRPAPRRLGPSGRRFEHRSEVHHDVIRRYRRWRLKWRVVGLVGGVAGLVLASAALSGDQALVGSMLLSFSLFAVAYVVSSVVLPLLRRPAGPVPRAVRVTNGLVDVEHQDVGSVDRFVVPDLRRVEVSADLAGDVVLRFVPLAGEASAYSLTGLAGADFRREVVPGFDSLRRALHRAGDDHGVPVVELQR